MVKDKHGKPSGPDVEFYFGANHQYKKGERIPVNINGHVYHAVVGAKNKLPKDVVSLLQNCKSSTAVPDLERYDPSRRGMPRKQEDFFNPETRIEYQSDFDIEVLDK